MSDPQSGFEDWYMLQSKMPYRTPKEIAEMAWFASGAAAQARITALTEENEQLKLECDTHRFDRRREQSESRLRLMEEALADLISDVENGYGDPHTMRYAKEALAQPADAKPEQVEARRFQDILIEDLVKSKVAAPQEKPEQADVWHLLHPMREKWSAICGRYERAGSNWHNEMPGDWPVQVTMTMDELRTLAAHPTPASGREQELGT